MTKTSLKGALLLGTIIGATNAQAQDAEPFDLGTIRIDTIAAQEVLGNDVVSEEDIENRAPATMADIFAGESSVTAGGGAAIAQRVFVNGIEESLLSVTIDGARQNKSAFHHTGNILLDPTLLKSVEVSKGIAPADAGPSALAGGLAYTTKDARDLLEPGETFGGLASVGADNNGSGFRRSATVFGQQGGFEWLLSATRHTGEDYKDGNGDTVPGTEPDLTALMLKLAYTTDTGKRLSFSASDTKDTGTRAAQAGPGGILFTRPDFAEVVGRTSTFIEGYSRRKSYTVTYSDEQPQGWFAPSVQLSYNEQEIDASGVAGINKSLSGTAKNVWQLGNGTVTAGLDFFRESAEGEGRGPGPFASSGTETLDSIGIFAQARQDLNDRVSVSYGARADYQQFEGADGSEFDGAGISVNGAVDVMLTDTLSFNAGVASSWGGYELGEAALINFGTAWDYTGFTSSRSQTARAGLRYDNGTFAASGAAFYTKIDNLNAVVPDSGARGAQADLESKGVEASLSYTGTQAFARVNYTYADVNLNDADIGSTAYYYGRPMGHIFGLEAGYDITHEWNVGGNAQIALPYDDGTLDLEGYEVVNAFVSYKPERVDGLELRLGLNNLFNETYARRNSDGVGSASVVPLNEPGRTISLNATMRF